MSEQDNAGFGVDFLQPKANADGTVSMQAHGSIAQQLLNGGFRPSTLRPTATMPNPAIQGAITAAGLKTNSDVNALKSLAMSLGIPLEVPTMHANAATLRWYEWQEYDQTLLVESLRPQRAVNALRAAGLTKSIGNGLGKTVLMYEDVSFLGDAEMSMDGESQRGNDRVEFTQKFLPLPIIHKSWFINARTLAASRETGEALDTTQAAMVGRRIGEYLENMTVNGASSYAFGGGTIYGFLDYLYRQTVAMTADWATATGNQILKDVNSMIAKAQAHFFYGPYILFISGNLEPRFGDDYSSNYAKPIIARIKELTSIREIVFVPFMNKAAGTATTSSAVLFQAAPDVARIVEGMPLTNVQWAEQGNMRFHFKGMQIAVPQIRSTQSNLCGVVHAAVGLSGNVGNA